MEIYIFLSTLACDVIWLNRNECSVNEAVTIWLLSVKGEFPDKRIYNITPKRRSLKITWMILLRCDTAYPSLQLDRFFLHRIFSAWNHKCKRQVRPAFEIRFQNYKFVLWFWEVFFSNFTLQNALTTLFFAGGSHLPF